MDRDLPMDSSSLWKRLTKREIIEVLPRGTFSTKEKRSRAKLEEAVMLLPPEQRTLLERTGMDKAMVLNGNVNANAVVDGSRETDVSQDPFFETVSEDCRRERISKFIDATGNKATATATCAVCAGTFFKQEIYETKLSDLRLKNKLAPSIPHPAQKLTDGMLLHITPSSLQVDASGVALANVCNSCTLDLRKNRTPAMSLANGLWIGDIPLELKVLTLLERVLVSRFFPAAYIVKLYPKKKGARTWASGLHSGLRGNVSTYRLSTDQIAHLASSHVMPPSSAILASTIGVTFVGPKNLPQRTMPGFLRVNRDRVRVALEWLKENNPLYINITISAERLACLPVDGVPDEISSLAKYSDDTRMLAEETDGYVPSDCADELGRPIYILPRLVRSTLPLLIFNSPVESIGDDEESEEEEETMSCDGVEGYFLIFRLRNRNLPCRTNRS